MKATASKPAKKRRLNINYGAQLLFGDGNTVTNPTINYNVICFYFINELNIKINFLRSRKRKRRMKKSKEKMKRRKKEMNNMLVFGKIGLDF